jgi:hypothetical protein
MLYSFLILTVAFSTSALFCAVYIDVPISLSLEQITSFNPVLLRTDSERAEITLTHNFSLSGQASSFMLRYVTVYAEPSGILRPSVIGMMSLQQVSARPKCQKVESGCASRFSFWERTQYCFYTGIWNPNTKLSMLSDNSDSLIASACRALYTVFIVQAYKTSTELLSARSRHTLR